jgi:Protein of unknown function (DUF3592)
MRTLALAVMFVIGALLCIAFGRAFQRSLRTREWTRVPGVIRASSISTTYSPGEQHYSPRLRYSYEYGGQRYEGEEIAVTAVAVAIDRLS